jgi:hypothetical protein
MFTEAQLRAIAGDEAYDAIPDAPASPAGALLPARSPPGHRPVKNALRGSARRPQRSPDKQASIERRRHLAVTSPLPSHLSRKFTLCEQAVLHITGWQVSLHGTCSLHVAAIAALAGTCPTVVRDAHRKARALGLLTVQERRRRGQRSLTNIVRVVSKEWRARIARKGGNGFPNTTTPKYSTASPQKPELVSGYRRNGSRRPDRMAQSRTDGPGGDTGG